MMNSNLLKLKPVLFVLTISLLFLSSSCMMTQTTVGAYKESAGAEYEYAKGKQVWLFEGLIPLVEQAQITGQRAHQPFIGAQAKFREVLAEQFFRRSGKRGQYSQCLA